MCPLTNQNKLNALQHCPLPFANVLAVHNIIVKSTLAVPVLHETGYKSMLAPLTNVTRAREAKIIILHPVCTIAYLATRA